MQSTIRLFTLSVMALLWSQSSDAQDISTTTPDSSERVTIIEHITASGENTVIMPAALRDRITPVGNVDPVTERPVSASTVSGGYRIQVFSDSNPRTAQSEARSKSANISSKFPSIRTYVTYDAPYWRLRVGDFTTYEDAADALSSLKEAFPSYRRELRIVRDHINVGN